MTYIISTNQVTQTAAPVVQPVSLAEAKAHLRVDGQDSDIVIHSMIKAATAWAESFLQATLAQTAYVAKVEGFSGVFQVPLLPLSSVTKIEYYTDGSPQVLTPLTDYEYSPSKGEIYITAGSIPNVADRYDAVQITYVTGSEPTNDSPPDPTGNISPAIKAAILLQVGELFENRQINSELRLQELPTAMMLLKPHRNY